ncbi:MAG TPA: AIR synthase-related protein, partial [Gemmatimonadales bacterium]|nr:AIR synthase-related protein [Gemmatimonadales bacterium]
GAALSIEMQAAIVEGVARGCRAHAMALAGGETAQMPGLYRDGDFDLAGTIIGVVEESEALHGDRVQPGDQLIAYRSSGLHTNGYTLARRVLFDTLGKGIHDPLPETGTTVAEVLLAVHRSYFAAIAPVVPRMHALAHITGGGISGNLIRVLPEGCEAVVDRASWALPPLFALIQEAGGVSDGEMLEVFNCGVGLIAVVPPAAVAAVRAAATQAGDDTWMLGEIRQGSRGVLVR